MSILVTYHSWVMFLLTEFETGWIVDDAVFTFFFHSLIQIIAFVIHILHCSERLLSHSLSKLVHNLCCVEVI